MASVYPGSLDSLATTKSNATVNANDHANHHNDLADAVNKIEAELGTNPSDTYSTVKARLDAVATGYQFVSGGGGVTDNLAAIQDAIDAATLAGGGTVLLSPGEHLVSGAIDLSEARKVTLAGLDGLLVSYPAATTIKASDSFPADTPIIKVDSPVGGDGKNVIRDLYLDCRSEAQDGVYTFDASGVYCRRVVVRAPLRDGFRFDGTNVNSSANQEIEDCYVNNPVNAAYYFKALFVRLTRAISDGGQYGIYADGTNSMIMGCHSEGAVNSGIYTSAAGGSARIIGNQIQSTTAGANGIYTNASAKVIGNTVNGLVGTPGTNGWGIAIGSTGVVVGNNVGGFDLQIVAGAGSGSVSMTSNELALGVQHGIYIDMTGSALVTGNIVKDVPNSLTILSGASVYQSANVFSGTVSPYAQKGVFLYGTVTMTSGTGSPEGVITAVVGSTYLRSDGGVGTTLYVKETGSGNTGWAAK